MKLRLPVREIDNKFMAMYRCKVCNNVWAIPSGGSVNDILKCEQCECKQLDIDMWIESKNPVGYYGVFHSYVRTQYDDGKTTVNVVNLTFLEIDVKSAKDL